MVYANMFDHYEECRKDDQNIGKYSRDAGYWQAGDRKEYGIMGHEDKDQKDREWALKEFRDLREADRAYFEDDIRDDVWFY